MKVLLTPLEGTLVCTPYVSEKATFKALKTAAGDVQTSTVVSVGKDYTDDHGIVRKPSCKEGDIVVHEYTPHSGEIDFKEYRFVKFYQVLSKLSEK